MTPAETARAMAAHPAWVWARGMTAVWPEDGSRWVVVDVGTDGLPYTVVLHDSGPDGRWSLWGQPGAAARFVPDLSDEPTRLLLLAVARRACGDPCLTTDWGRREDGQIVWFCWARGEKWRDYPTEYEALAAAILAAPGRDGA